MLASLTSYLLYLTADEEFIFCLKYDYCTALQISQILHLLLKYTETQNPLHFVFYVVIYQDTAINLNI